MLTSDFNEATLSAQTADLKTVSSELATQNLLTKLLYRPGQTKTSSMVTQRPKSGPWAAKKNQREPKVGPREDKILRHPKRATNHKAIYIYT